MRELDVRGLSCPEPVVRLKEVYDKDPKGSYKVLASEYHTVKNIINFATSVGKKTRVTEVDMDYEVIVE